MADRCHAEVPEVLGRQLGQDYLVYRVFPECLLVAFQAEAAKPGTNIHGIHTHTWPHSSTGYGRRHVGRYVSRAPAGPRTKERAREGSPENGAQPDDPPALYRARRRGDE